VTADPLGIVSEPGYQMRVTPDGRSYVYEINRRLEELYLVTGAR